MNAYAKSTGKLTSEEKSRSVEIARIIERLPEQEQRDIYYMIKGIEFAGSQADPASQTVSTI